MDSPVSAPSVSLPSIHEMFPDHLLHKNDNDSIHRGSQGSPKSDRSSRSPRTGSPSSTHSRPRSGTEAQDSRSQHHGQRVVSFDVLRSDPSNSSLQHLTSSTTYPNRGASMTFQSGVDRGSAPAFRVSVAGTQPVVAPSDASSSSSTAGASTSGPRGAVNLPADMAGMYIKEPPHQMRSTAVHPNYPSIISFPVSGPGPNARQQEPMHDDGGSDDEGSNEPSTGKKHVCPTCFKRFNRPSSLRIHVNTHTGATPFRCPWPNCGREFNVNSNMRRHYRNHTTPGFSRQPNEVRRRRRRIEPGIVEHRMGDHHVPTLRRIPPESFGGGYPGSDESDGYESDYAKSGPGHDDLLDCDLHPASWAGNSHSMHRGSSRGSSRSSAASVPHGHPPQYPHHSQQSPHQYHYPPPAPGYAGHDQRPPPPPSQHHSSRQQSTSSSYPQQQYRGSPRHHPYSLPGGRAYTPAGSSFHSSSPSPSPSPPPASIPARQHPRQAPGHKEPVYNASIPYLRSVADSNRVSTTLRPAFSSTPSRSTTEKHSYTPGRASFSPSLIPHFGR